MNMNVNVNVNISIIIGNVNVKLGTHARTGAGEEKGINEGRL
jgi:hypothetical protein